MVNEKEVMKTFKKPLIWVSIISILVILLMASYINVLNNQLSNVYDTYEYSCSEGTYRACIENGKNYISYPEGEYAITIKDDETYTVCDTDRKERAICVDEDTYWNPCQEGTYQVCADKDRDYISCGIGEDARCIKEDNYATISSSGYLRYCDIGESSICMN